MLRRYDDGDECDFSCPFGLPIGDERQTPLVVRPKSTIVPENRTTRCIHMVKVGCCKAECREGLPIMPGRCNAEACAAYVERES